MKPFAIITATLLACSTAFISQAQNTLTIPDYPAELNYLTDYQLNQESKKSFTVFDPNVGTEFYINLFKVSNRFNSDSLRILMYGLYEEDPSVKNLQVNEVASGMMGPHNAERCVISFMTEDDKRYVCTAYLVYFHLNKKVNSVLYYFEIGETNVVSYAPVQEAMMSSLKYKEFPYKKYTYAIDSVSLEYPDFWSVAELKDKDTALVIDDDRLKIRIASSIPKDSTTAIMSAETERDLMKKDIATWRELKVTSKTDKWKEEPVGKISGTFVRDVNTVDRKIGFSKYFFRRKVGNREKEFTVYFEYPEVNEKYYGPMIQKISNSISIPGTVIVVEKKTEGKK